MTMKINGGIISQQTLTGSLRYFKMTGPFAWTVSDGSVNLPVAVSGGATTATTYFAVGNNVSVPNSAAELALAEISTRCGIDIIGIQPGLYGTSSEIQFACPAMAFGWGADVPSYSTAPANSDEDLTAAAVEIQSAVRSLGILTVYVSVGATNQSIAPVTSTADMSTVIITEVPFKLA